MKKYDQIWVPNENGDYKLHEFYEDHHEWVDSHEPLVSRKSNAIVLNVEDLKEMWQAAMNHGVRPYDTESCYDYLQSKGIQL